MKTKISLKKYEDLYDAFDGGHDRKHLEEVRSFAIKLAKNYAPNQLEIVYVAATLHDVGISISRGNHELHGYKMISRDNEIKNAYSKEEFAEILEAIKEHRASSGNPKSVVAKIISDADKCSFDGARGMERAYKWGCENLPTLNHDGQLLRAAYHLRLKFGDNGIGTRLYFEESKQQQSKAYIPVFKALETYDLKALNELLESVE